MSLMVPSAEKVDPPSQLHFTGCVVGQPTRDEVLKREADAPKDRDLFWRLTTWPETDNYFSQLGVNRSGSQACASTAPISNASFRSSTTTRAAVRASPATSHFPG